MLDIRNFAVLHGISPLFWLLTLELRHEQKHAVAVFFCTAFVFELNAAVFLYAAVFSARAVAFLCRQLMACRFFCWSRAGELSP